MGRNEFRKFDAPTVTVGRGFDNDLILHDEYVSENHLVIRSQENVLVIEDRGSENGVYYTKARSLVKEARLLSGDEIKIGKTRLRIYSPSHPIGPAKRMSGERGVLKKLSEPAGAWLALFILLFIYTVEGHLASTENLTPPKLLAESLAAAIIAVIVAGAWAFVGRLVTHKAMFSAHLAGIALFLAVMVPIDIVTSNLGYHTNSATVEYVCSALLSGAAFTLLLAWNLTNATNLPLKKRFSLSSGMTLIFFALAALFMLSSNDEFDASPGYYTILKPPIVKILPSGSVALFIEESRKVFDAGEGEK